MKFFKNAMSELEHVVWPTAQESKRYMLYTIMTIIIMGTLLAIIGYFLRNGMATLRGQFEHVPLETTVSGEDFVTEEELQKLQEEAEKRRNALSGETPVAPVTLPAAN
jgi:preprotein translocase SecE subunit